MPACSWMCPGRRAPSALLVIVRLPSDMTVSCAAKDLLTFPQCFHERILAKRCGVEQSEAHSAAKLATNLPHQVCANLHYKAKQRITLQSVMRCFYYTKLARPRRFERPTPAFGGQYSIQLSYGRKEGAKHSVFRRWRPSGQANTPPYSPREFGNRGRQTLPLGFTTRQSKT